MTSWHLYVRNAAGAIVGEVDDFTALHAIVRWNALGTWQIDAPRGSKLDQLLAPGGGIALYRDDDLVIAGQSDPITRRMTDTGERTITAAGRDDAAILAELRALPDTDNLPAAQTVLYDVRSGPAGTVIGELLDDNLARWITRFGDLVDVVAYAYGSIVTARARFQVLSDLVHDLANEGDIGLVAGWDRTTGKATFTIVQPTDRSTSIVFSEERETLLSWEYTTAPPTCTRAFAAGQGDGLDRTIVEASDFDIETIWRRRVESWVDRRDTKDASELSAAAGNAVADGTAGSSIRATVTDRADQQWLTHYQLGDQVAVAVDGVTFVERVRAVDVTLSADGPLVRPVIGPAGQPLGTGAAVDRLFGRVRTVTRRVELLERATTSTDGPTDPKDLAISDVTASGATLTWLGSAVTVGAGAQYVITVYDHAAGDYIDQGSTSGLTFDLFDLDPVRTYTPYVKAYDIAGRESNNVAGPTFTTLAAGGGDTTDPSVPTGLASHDVTNTTIGLTWSASTDNVAVGSYRLYRDGTLIASVPATPRDYTFRSLAPSTSYSLTVAAVDTSGNASAQSAALTVTTTSAPRPTPGSITLGAAVARGTAPYPTYSGLGANASGAALKENSGMVASRRWPGKYWTQRDSAVSGEQRILTLFTPNAAGSTSAVGSWAGFKPPVSGYTDCEALTYGRDLVRSGQPDQLVLWDVGISTQGFQESAAGKLLQFPEPSAYANGAWTALGSVDTRYLSVRRQGGTYGRVDIEAVIHDPESGVVTILAKQWPARDGAKAFFILDGRDQDAGRTGLSSSTSVRWMADEVLDGGSPLRWNPTYTISGHAWPLLPVDCSYHPTLDVIAVTLYECYGIGAPDIQIIRTWKRTSPSDRWADIIADDPDGHDSTGNLVTEYGGSSIEAIGWSLDGTLLFSAQDDVASNIPKIASREVTYA